MSAEKTIFASFLQELGITDIPLVLERFEHYLSLLSEYNQGVNLISRSMPASEYWTKHFLDSLFPFKCLAHTGQKALDFGSGGGLPGIAIKLVYPQMPLTLLDSVGKKTRILSEMSERLQLQDLEVVNARLEDYISGKGQFDLILCRAVRMEERYRKPLYRLLAAGGRVIFYKAQDSSDLQGLQPKLICEQSFDWGSRKIYEVKRKSLVANIYKPSNMDRKWGR